MSLFVVAYDKSAQRLIAFEQLPSSQRTAADKRRSELEVANQGRVGDVEVVVLEAPSKKALLSTHSRYFRSAEELVRLMQAGTPSRAEPKSSKRMRKGSN
jgi:hypothetical protein